MSRKRKLPAGLWQRGDVYYARFTHGGREIRKRLSTDFAVARQGLNDLRARADRGDLGIIDNDFKWDELKAEFLRWARQSVRASADYERDLARFEACCESLLLPLLSGMNPGESSRKCSTFMPPLTVSRSGLGVAKTST